MKKLILAALLAAASTIAVAELKILAVHDLNARLGTVTSFYDTVSEQYCLMYQAREATAMNCKALHKLSEQAKKNILGDSYVPKPDVGTCEAGQDNCPKN
ncbi:hypothetical protein [Endozoicomonas sp. 4G]|uniref:hypothetical protein n=1 Tax=Endozoicomonas sp. 4G TaxID=2872754 RepID=UPI002078B942|nr:hypothetical protein [Endozoicomonas sp. 4G]